MIEMEAKQNYGFSQIIESMLSTRLADDTFRGIINYYRTTKIDTPTDEIHQALVSKHK